MNKYDVQQRLKMFFQQEETAPVCKIIEVPIQTGLNYQTTAELLKKQQVIWFVIFSAENGQKQNHRVASANDGITQDPQVHLILSKQSYFHTFPIRNRDTILSYYRCSVIKKKRATQLFEAIRFIYILYSVSHYMPHFLSRDCGSIFCTFIFHEKQCCGHVTSASLK